MPKIKEKSRLSKRQHRRLVEKEYKNLSSIKQDVTDNEPLTTHQLSPPTTVSADSVVSLDSTDISNSLDATCPQNNDDDFILESKSDDATPLPSFEFVDTINDSENNSSKNNFVDDLRNWAVTRNITHADITALLKVLRDHGFDVPSDSRTLTKTPRHLEIIEMSPGNYFHFGLRPGLSKSISQYYLPGTCPSEIKINIGIDGLPLTKSSGSQFWPILAAIEADFETVPFVIGMYHGYQKPADSNEFLKYFVEEFEDVSATGIILSDHEVVQIGINAFICDAPAKAFITGTKGHNAYFGCGKCVQEGEFIKNGVTYPEVDANLRTDQSFRQKSDDNHHKKLSILERLLICMIMAFPLDYMHLVCLGVMKKLLKFWVMGKKDVRMTDENLIRASNHLLSLNRSISKEFARKARPLQEVNRFKATELRQLLLYTGPVIFKDTLTKDQYNNFLSLSIAIRILGSPELHLKNNDYARSLLIHFVKTFPLLYGRRYVSYNVHNLVHLSEDVKSKGPLDKFSAFKFENYMLKIKKMVKTSSKPLQQYIKRHQEQCNLNSTYKSGRSARSQFPIIKYHRIQHSIDTKTIKSIEFNSFLLSTKIPDNCCCLKDGVVVIVEQIHFQNNKTNLIGKAFTNPRSLFDVPCESSKLGIIIANNQSCQSVKFDVSNIKSKCLKFKLTESESVILPMLHHS